MSNRLNLQAARKAPGRLPWGKSADRGADAAWAAIVAAASDAYRCTDGHAVRFARSKLGRDRVFRHLLEQGLIAPKATVLDIGCGQGLLASLLRAAGDAAGSGRWPPTWAAAPVGAKVIGVDRSARDIARAASMTSRAATFVLGDMRRATFPPCDVAVFFDTLHYITIDEQDDVLGECAGRCVPAAGYCCGWAIRRRACAIASACGSTAPRACCAAADSDASTDARCRPGRRPSRAWASTCNPAP